jgi:hypothetical protein
MKKIRNINTQQISSDPIHGGLYEVYYFTNSFRSFMYECFNFEINGDYCFNKIHDSKFIKLEDFKDVKYLLVIIHDRKGHVSKWMKIGTELDSIKYQLSWESTDLSKIDVIFKINEIETHTIDNYEATPESIIKQIKRDLKISTIIE